MTDRICALTVALDRDIREDNIQQIVTAIETLRCVCGVTVHIVDTADYAARARADLEWRKKILALLAPTTGGTKDV